MLLSILTVFDASTLASINALSSIAHPSFTVSIGQLMGCAILVFSVFIIALSSHRYLLFYGLAGMGYWLLIEAMHSLIVFLLPISSWNAYVAALAISWSPLYIWLIRRTLADTNKSSAYFSSQRIFGKKSNALKQDKYIEHTPIYDDDYRPKFQ